MENEKILKEIESLRDDLHFVEDVAFSTRATSFAMHAIILEFVVVMARAKIIDLDKFFDAIKGRPIEGENEAFRHSLNHMLDAIAELLRAEGAQPQKQSPPQ